MWDRFFNLQVHHYMQSIIGDRLRPADKKDPFGVEQTRAKIKTSLDFLEQNIGRQ